MPSGRDKNGKGIGRPRIEIDEAKWAQIEQLCFLQCTAEEIASVMKMSVDTIERRIAEKYEVSFAEYIKTHSAGGKASLRRKQFALADRSAAMAIWLGKQYLGQREPNNAEAMDVEDAQAIFDEALKE